MIGPAEGPGTFFALLPIRAWLAGARACIWPMYPPMLQNASHTLPHTRDQRVYTPGGELPGEVAEWLKALAC
jgi:hypothetical protein